LNSAAWLKPVGSYTFVQMEIVEPAKAEERRAIPYVGIRIVAPFRGMLAARDRLLAEARAEIKEAGIKIVGYGFLRLPSGQIDQPIPRELLESITVLPGHLEGKLLGAPTLPI
jgi:hypothetical protein